MIRRAEFLFNISLTSKSRTQCQTIDRYAFLICSGTGGIRGGTREIARHGRRDAVDNLRIRRNDSHVAILIGHLGREIAAAYINGIVVYRDGLGMDVDRCVRLIETYVNTAGGQGVEPAHVGRGIGHGQIDSDSSLYGRN